MEVSSYALVTVQEVSTVLGIEAELQDQVIWCINAISQTAQRMAGRIFVERIGETIYLEGDHDGTIIVPDYPISEIQALYMDQSRVFDEDSLVPASSYDVDKECGIIYLLDRLTPKGRRTIKLVATIGYSSIPEDLKNAVIEGVSWMMSRFNDRAVGIASISSSEGINTSYERYLPASIKDVFLGYKTVRI